MQTQRRSTRFILPLLTALVLVAVAFAGGASAPIYAQSLEGWDFRREITVDNSGNAAKTDYQVKVELTSANFSFSSAESDGTDIRFTAADGETLLDFWRQDYDSVGEEATFWVKVPTVPENDSTTVWIYYGNNSAEDASSINDTFLTGIDFTDSGQMISGVDDPGAAQLFNRQGIPGSTVVLASAVPNFDGFANSRVGEHDGIVHDPNDPNLGTNPEREYKIYFRAQNTNGNNRVFVAFSEDGETFGNITRAILGSSDPESDDPSVVQTMSPRGQVYRDGEGKMYLLVERGASTPIDGYESTDGINWTALTNPLLEKGGVGTWEEFQAASPLGRHDGTNFIVGYEGSNNAGDDQFGIAIGTDLNNLTKSVHNPLFGGGDHSEITTDSVVVDWMGLNDTEDEIILMFHESGGTKMARIHTTNTDPTTWDGNSLVEFGDGPLQVGTASEIHIDNATGDLSRILMITAQGSAIVRFDITGPAASPWMGQRLQKGTNANNPQRSFIYIDENEHLILQPEDRNAQSNLSLQTVVDIGVANNFEIIARAKQEAQTSDNRAMMGFGSGDFAFVSGEHRANFADGWAALFLNPNLIITGYDGHSETVGDSAALSSDDRNNFRERKMSFLSDGSLRIEVGSSVIDTSEAAQAAFSNLTGNKKISYVQGQINEQAAVSHLDWLLARSYDGEDPAQTVGSEEELTGSSAALSGTVTNSINETDVRGGGLTVILTLTDATWVADDGTFAAQRQNIINGITSAQSEATGWNAEVRDNIAVGGVVRTSDTIVTVTTPAAANYLITAQETITATIPASATSHDGALVAAPTFTVTDLAADATLSNLVVSEGTLTPAFDSGTTSYTVDVTNGVTSIDVTATANDANHDSITINATPATSGQPETFMLAEGANLITVTVVAEDAVTDQDYEVTVTRAAGEPDPTPTPTPTPTPAPTPAPDECRITSTSLPRATPDEPYSATLQAADCVAPLTWSVTAGTLPTGLTLGESTGTISGTPTVENTFAFTVQVEDDEAETAARQFSIQVAPLSAIALTLLTILPVALGFAVVLGLLTMRATSSVVVTGGVVVIITIIFMGLAISIANSI